MSKNLIGRETVENTLHSLFCATFCYSSPEEKTRLLWAFYAIERYVNTARASVDFLRALQRANPAKLMRHAAKHAGTDEECIATVSAYLTRYCGMSA